MRNRWKEKHLRPDGSTRPKIPAVTASREFALAHQVLGAKIRELREKKGLPQEMFAAGCGLPPWRLRKIEQGESEIWFSVLFRVAMRLEVSLFYLLEGIDEYQGA